MNDDIHDAWVVAEGRHEGQRLVVRLNTGLRPMVGNKQYPFRVGIAIPFLSPQKDGMPNEEELEQFNRIEDTIFNRFAVKHTGLLCIIITTHGMREFILYAKTGNIDGMLEDVSLHFPAYTFQHYVEPDTDWNEFSHWTERLGK